MTRLTIAVAGDPYTFRPVTSKVIRKSKDGDIHVMNMLLGSHYNINHNGMFNTQFENIDGTVSGISSTWANAWNSKLHLNIKKGSQNGNGEVGATFISHCYFYPGLIIDAHLQFGVTFPLNGSFTGVHLGEYIYTDVATGNELIFRIVHASDKYEFKMLEKVNNQLTELFSEAMDSGEYYFNFKYLDHGRSKLYKVLNIGNPNVELVRKWIGDLNNNYGECRCTYHAVNSATTLTRIYSDYMFLYYPKMFLKFDRDPSQIYKGQIKFFDNLNSTIENEWLRIRSRDYKFVGDRIIENGIIRVVIPSNNPEIQIWGWNYFLGEPLWQKAITIDTRSDSGIRPHKIQNVIIEYLNNVQAKIDLNFGTAYYTLYISRGNPYITLVTFEKSKFLVKSDKDRFGYDAYALSGITVPYMIANSEDDGNPKKRGSAPEVITEVAAIDNYFGFYNYQTANDMVGWISNHQSPNSIRILDQNGIQAEFRYNVAANVFGVGVLPLETTASTTGPTAAPFVIGEQDEYVKWRANEALYAYRELETFKKR